MFENNENYSSAAYSEPKKSGFGRMIAIALCCSVLGGALGAGGTYAVMSGNAPQLNSAVIYESTREMPTLNVAYSDGDSSPELSAADVYELNVNSAVGITTSVDTNFFGYRTTSAASGSGFILTENGYIVTNYHVIADANSITVTTFDGSSYPAEPVGYDEDNDIAVLKIDAEGLKPVTLGDSGKSRVGDQVCAIGNPLGELTFSLTGGLISALDRNVTIEGTAMNLIQTDCAINSGNSGGPLFNMYGEVIGITNAKISGNSMSEASVDNIGFAIPINSVKDIITGIITDGTVEKPYIGVTISALGSEYRRFGLYGVVIQEVEEDSPADKAGLKADDVITAVNGEEITDNSDLTGAVSKCRDGDVLKLSVTRQGEKLEISVTVSVRKRSALGSSEQQEETDEDYRGFGYFPWYGQGSGTPM